MLALPVCRLDRLQSDQVKLFTGKRTQAEHWQVLNLFIKVLSGNKWVNVIHSVAAKPLNKDTAQNYSRVELKSRVTGHVQDARLGSDVIGVEQRSFQSSNKSGADLATMDKAVQYYRWDPAPGVNSRGP